MEGKACQSLFLIDSHRYSDGSLYNGGLNVVILSEHTGDIFFRLTTYLYRSCLECVSEHTCNTPMSLFFIEPVGHIFHAVSFKM